MTAPHDAREIARLDAEVARLRQALDNAYKSILGGERIALLESVYEAARAWKASDCSIDCPLHAEGPHAHHCPERAAIMKLCEAIDAAIAKEPK